jgi:DNA polymerase-1
MAKSKEKLLIIDGSAVMYRAWHALPPFTIKDGTVVNAVYGFLLAYFKLLADVKPTHVVVAFDLAEPTFRHEQYAEYKAGRAEQPDEFYNQFDILRDVLDVLKIARVEAPGFEADDIIGTITKESREADTPVVVATSDLDTMQLVNGKVSVMTFGRAMNETKIYDVAGVKERFGLSPEQMVDYRALKGDPSDNIPGVPGIGDKTASALIATHGSLDKLYEYVEETDKPAKPLTPRLRQLLIDHKKEAEMSRSLSQIHCDVPLKTKLSDYKLGVPDGSAVVAKMQELEFKSILAKLPENIKTGAQSGSSTKNNSNYILIDTQVALDELIKKLKQAKEFAFDTETTSLNVIDAELVGMSFSWQAGTGYYVQVDRNEKFIETLKPVLEDGKLKKWGHNIKYDLEVLRGSGITLHGVAGDTMIAAYLLNPGSRGYKLDDLAFTEFGHKMIPITDLIGDGKEQITMREVEPSKIAVYAAEDADFCWRLKELLAPKLKSQGANQVMNDIEIPLIEVLADMELTGIKVDAKVLKKADDEALTKMVKLEKQIYKLAGEEFNIASPKQLKAVLFEKLHLSTDGIGKTKTGISTAANELEKLRDEHEIIPLIFDYRELAKLHSTYLDALPKQINKKTKRVHTSFNQTIAATGRLSSIDPNLQNIPIRSEMGQRVREAFVADKGKVLLTADYSQFELRIVASIANDKTMIDIFKRGDDIHRATASVIHGIPEEKVTKEIRYTAKEVNFGVLYGMGPWGLSQRTGLTQKEAREFIDKYFEAFSGLKKFMDDTIAKAKKHGYVETMFGRRRYLPEINSGVQQVRQGAERMAINLPVQGSQADIIKLAMINIYKKLPKVSRDSKMLLQVHDELVFEVPEKDVGAVADLVKKEMESVIKLKVPVVVNVSVGKSWGNLQEML